MRLSAMGDVAMTVPVLRAFVKQYPEVKITVISLPFFEPFFEGIENVSFFAFDKKKKHKGFLGLLQLYKDLKPLQIDAFADLHNVLRSKVIRTIFALNLKKVAAINKGRKGKKALTRAENKIFAPLPTMFQNHCKVFEQLGFVVGLSNPVFSEKSVLSQDLKAMIGKPQFLIGIAPFAQYNAKVYPEALMREVITTLAKNPAYTILLFGGGAKEIELLKTHRKKGKKGFP